MNDDREIRVQIPGDDIPTRIVFELPDGERWGTASGTFDHYSGAGTYQLRQLPNRREQLEREFAAASAAHAIAQQALSEAVDEIERTNAQLVTAARAIRDHGKGEVRP